MEKRVGDQFRSNSKCGKEREENSGIKIMKIAGSRSPIRCVEGRGTPQF